MWLLIDGNNWFAQCEFASPGDGQVNFVRRVETLLGQVEHTRAVICWDLGKSWRCEEDAGYKAHRAAKPDGYAERLEATRVLDIPGVLCLSAPNYEADDLIATLTWYGKQEGERVVIFSSDKDLFQLLLAGSVCQVKKVTRVGLKLEFEVMTADRLFDAYGAKPWQWVDYRAIVGDTSDGIKGCDGIGEKAAKSLVSVYGSLDEFFDDPFKAELTARQRALLINYRDQLPHKRKLLTLVDSVPIPEFNPHPATLA